MSTPIVNQPARRRKQKVEPEFSFDSGNINRYRVRACAALKAETLLNEAGMKIKDALDVAAKESSNGTKNHGDDPLLDEKFLHDLYLDLVDVVLKVRDTCQTRVRSLRLMEEFGEGEQ